MYIYIYISKKQSLQLRENSCSVIVVVFPSRTAPRYPTAVRLIVSRWWTVVNVHMDRLRSLRIVLPTEGELGY